MPTAPTADNPYSFSVKLKQHTPMIHFQWQQEGATLRASELKPKLDRFIVTKLGGREKALQNEWCHPSPERDICYLDYQVKISVSPVDQPNSSKIELGIFTNKKGKYETDKFPFVLANMGGKQNKGELKQFEFESQSLIINFFCYHSRLLNLIQEYFSEFLYMNNFGNRQTKGFGSFYIERNENKILEKFKPKFRFSIDVSEGETHAQKLKIVFEAMELLWRSLRSGINEGKRDRQKQVFVTTFYFKSLMFVYARNNKIQWEKKTIKENFYNKELTSQQKRHPLPQFLNSNPSASPLPLWYSSPNKRLMKDMLGLAVEEEWIAEYDDKIFKEHDLEGEEAIERMSSPLFFKPIYNAETDKFEIYLILKAIPKGFYGQSFQIKNKKENQPFNIQTPKRDEANLNDFLDYIFVRKKDDKYVFELEKHVEDKFKQSYDHKEKKKIPNKTWVMLKKMIEEIRKNYSVDA